MSESEMQVHEYDGITELDNQLPRWWLLLFYFTIAYGVVYLTYYHVLGKGLSSKEAYVAEVAAAKEVIAAATSAAGSGGEGSAAAAQPLEAGTDEAVLAEGKQIFATYCFTCHAADGGGLIGPNMTDDYFIHGPAFADSIRTATEGVPEKGMIAWKTVLKPEQIHAVCSYIYTLRGTTPVTAKAPEGEQYPASK